MERRWLPLTLVILLVMAAFFLARAKLIAHTDVTYAGWLVFLAFAALAIGWSKIGPTR